MVCWLPHRAALAIGRGLGSIAYRFGGKRRAIVHRNLELCFPDMTDVDREDLARRHFGSLGIMVIEMGLGRWASDKHLDSITTIRGLEHLEKALATGQGVILLSAHFTALEVCGRAIKHYMPPYYAVYRKARSEFVTEMMRRGRERSAEGIIEKSDIKQMVRRLRDGGIVWYAPDQSYNRKGSVIVPFFGIPTMHMTATSTLARLGKAVVVPFFPLRLENGHYVAEMLPHLTEFPSDDPVEDTLRYIRILEDRIREFPEQYFWIHRKFKNLPDEYPDYYADLAASK